MKELKREKRNTYWLTLTGVYFYHATDFVALWVQILPLTFQ